MSEETKDNNQPVLFDTDILIWYFRGLDTAAELLANTIYEHRFISSVCVMELVQGCRNKKELRTITTFIKNNCSVIHIDKEISEKAIELIRSYALSHGLRTVDAIIAATAIVHKSSLATGNTRHFEMIGTIPLIRFDSRAQ